MKLFEKRFKWWGLLLLASIPMAALLVYTSLHWLSKEMESEKLTEFHATKSLVAAEKLRSAAESRSIASRGYLIAGTAEFLDLFDRADSEFRTELKELQGLADSPKEQESLRAIYVLEADYLATVYRVHQMQEQKSASQAITQLFKDRVAPASHRLIEKLDELVTVEMNDLTAVRAGAESAEGDWLERVRVGVTALFLLVAMFGILLWRSLTKLYSRLRTSLVEKEEALAVLNTVLKEAPIGIALFDSKFRYTRINIAAAEMNALPEAEHIGKSMQSVFPSIWERLKPVFHDVLFTGVPRTGVEVSAEHRKSGRLHHCLCNYHPVKSPTGRVIGVAAMFLDITERKEAEESLRRRERELREFLENAPLALRWLDTSGTIVWANELELKCMGYEKEEYLGSPIAKFFQDPSMALQLLDRLRSGLNVNDFRAQMRRKDGSPLTCIVNIGVYREAGKISGFRCYTRFGVPPETGIHVPTLVLASEKSYPTVAQPTKE